ETQTPAEVVDEATEAPEAPETPPEAPGDDTAVSEAKRYRKRAQEAETQRDALAEQVTALQTAEVERIAEAEGIRPAGLWAADTQLADLLDEAGTVDATAVKRAVTEASTKLGLSRPLPPAPPAANQGIGL